MNMSILFRMLRKAFDGWRRHDATSLAAALAFHTSLSLAPLLLFVVALVSTLYDEMWVEQQIVTRLREYVGDEVATALWSILRSANQNQDLSGDLVTVGSILILLFSASAVFRQLQISLNRVWCLKPNPDQNVTQSGINAAVRYLRSFAMVIAIGVLLLLSLVVNTLLALPDNDLFGFQSFLESAQSLLHWFVLPVVIAILFVVTLKILPNGRIPWRAIGVGAAVTTALFMPGEYLIGLYLATTSAGSFYGAAGTLIVVLMWVYYSSLIYLFGVEFARAYADERIYVAGNEAEQDANG